MDENVLINLKVLALLEKNQKISINGNLIIIDYNTLFQGIRRWWYESNREKGIIFIDTLINNLDSDYKKLIRKKNTVSNNRLINTVQLYLRNSIDGLENMKHTYKDDTENINKLDDIILKIKVILNLK